VRHSRVDLRRSFQRVQKAEYSPTVLSLMLFSMMSSVVPWRSWKDAWPGSCQVQNRTSAYRLCWRNACSAWTWWKVLMIMRSPNEHSDRLMNIQIWYGFKMLQWYPVRSLWGIMMHEDVMHIARGDAHQLVKKHVHTRSQQI